MTGRWTRNRDEVLVYVSGDETLGGVFPVGLGTYPRPWKAVAYHKERVYNARQVVGMYAGTSEAKRAIEEYWNEHA